MTKGSFGLAAALLCGLPALISAAPALTPSTAPDKTPDGFPIVWLGNAEKDGLPTSTMDAVPAAFQRARIGADQFVRFTNGNDKRAYGCYTGDTPQVMSWQLLEVHGREESEGVKQTFRVAGWRVVCKRLAVTVDTNASSGATP